MKKALFFLSFVAMMGLANAQLNVVYNSVDVLNDDTVTVNVNSPEDEFVFSFDLQNNDTEDFSGRVEADSTDANIFVTGICADVCMVGRVSPSFSIPGGETYENIHVNFEVASGLSMGYSVITKISVLEGLETRAEFWVKLVVNTSSLQTAENASLLTYPNPAKDFVTLSLQNADLSANAKVQMLNAMGAVVKEMPMTSDNMRISVKDMPAGVYACRIADGQKIVATKKIVVK